jgi:predicted SnoaL-like aldol condensation-catalyzing enzyme
MFMFARPIGYPLLLLGLVIATATPTLAAGRSSQASGQVDEATLENQNRAIVRRIYDEVFNQDNTATAYELFGTNLIQHDEGAVDGPDGQLALFDNLRSNMPGVVATIKHIAADGDLVAVHWQASATPDDEFSGQAVIDLWRLTDGVVVEHWDGIQPVPASSASGNSMFSDAYVYPQGAPTITEADEEAERQMVVSTYLDVDNNQNLQTIETMFDPPYLQHNPNTPSGIPAFIAHVQSLAPHVVGPRLTILQSLADQDLVFTIRNGGGNSIAADIWRVVDGKIMEHWDVIPARPTQ